MNRDETVYASLPPRWKRSRWLEAVCETSESALREGVHGDLPRWRTALNALPEGGKSCSLDQDTPALGSTIRDHEALRGSLMEFHPWRKGPLQLGGLTIDTEWRSDWKWRRIAPHVDLEGHRVLDIGCGNGYFGLRMLGAGARLVVGVDPTLVFVMQWLACRHFSGDIANYVLPIGIEQLPADTTGLDTVFSMGVLYHRKRPQDHLRRLHALFRPGGTLVLESLVLSADRSRDVLIPEGRYARMRNVRCIPGTGRLLEWITSAGFSQARVVDVTPTTTLEQRTTDWMTFESLEQALDPADPTRTVEGEPAPVRAVVIASA